MVSQKCKILEIYLQNLKPLSREDLYSRVIIAVEFLMFREDVSGIMPKQHASNMLPIQQNT